MSDERKKGKPEFYEALDIFDTAMDEAKPYAGAAVGALIGRAAGRRGFRRLSNKELEALKAERRSALNRALSERGQRALDAEARYNRLLSQDVDEHMGRSLGGLTGGVGGATIGAYAGWQQKKDTKRRFREYAARRKKKY